MHKKQKISSMKSSFNNEVNLLINEVNSYFVNNEVSLLVDIAEDLDIKINYDKSQYLDLLQCLVIMKLGK